MSDERNIPDEPEGLAAEYALGLLSGDELRRARERVRTDPAFRQEVARWRGRLVPMLDDVDAAEPPASAWQAIEQRLGGTGDGGNVLQLRRRVTRWRGFAGAMTALAACLAIFIVVRPPPPVPAPVPVERPAAAPPLLAMLGEEGKGTKVVASWDPDAQRLVLAVTGDMQPDPTHSHELWVIPSDGKPRSLGTMGDKKMTHMQLADALAELLQQGATIAISVEPPGGSPTGAPTGPVVAAGALTKA
jgi:anti-sigma-K factor RskA